MDHWDRIVLDVAVNLAEALVGLKDDETGEELVPDDAYVETLRRLCQFVSQGRLSTDTAPRVVSTTTPNLKVFRAYLPLLHDAARSVLTKATAPVTLNGPFQIAHQHGVLVIRAQYLDALFLSIGIAVQEDAARPVPYLRRCVNERCDGPHGPRFFVRTRKEEYCSPACANRAHQRAHYQREKEAEANARAKVRATARRKR
jgi:hypothetical protein